MFMLLVFSGMMLLVTTPTDIVLSTWIGIGCCGQPISIRVCRVYTHLRAVMNKEANSASAVEDIMNFKI